LTGLLVGVDYAGGRALDESRDYAAHAEFFRSVFEIGRRYKIMNPEKMRTAYAKLMYILQDSMQPQIQDILGFELVAPLVTVYSTLEAGGALGMLSDPMIDVATRECLPRDENGREKTRREMEAEIEAKDKATEILGRKYASERITADGVRQCLYSIKDNNSFLRCNRDPIDQAIVWLDELYGKHEEMAEEKEDSKSSSEGSGDEDDDDSSSSEEEGEVKEKKSVKDRFSWNEIKRLFWQLIEVIILFFKTIFMPNAADDAANKKDRYYGGSGYTTGGNGGGGNGGNDGPPRRPMGRIQSNRSMNCPTST